MIRQSVRTGRTFSTSSIQREVIQAQGHSGSNQNCTSSCGCPVTPAATAPRARVFPGYRTASASRPIWSGEAVVGTKMSSSQPAEANAAA